MLRNDEALSTTWSDQPGCLPKINLQLPHKVHFNYTLQTSLKSPIFPFVYLRECHINWLITVFLSHFQKNPRGRRGEWKRESCQCLTPEKKKRQTWRHEDSWMFPEEGVTEKGCNAAGTDVLLWDGRSRLRTSAGMASSGSTAQGGQGEGWGHSGTLPGHPAQPWPWPCSFHLPMGWAEHALHSCAVHSGHPAVLRQMRGSSFSRGVIQFTCILCCIMQE